MDQGRLLWGNREPLGSRERQRGIPELKYWAAGRKHEVFFLKNGPLPGLEESVICQSSHSPTEQLFRVTLLWARPTRGTTDSKVINTWSLPQSLFGHRGVPRPCSEQGGWRSRYVGQHSRGRCFKGTWKVRQGNWLPEDKQVCRSHHPRDTSSVSSCLSCGPPLALWQHAGSVSIGTMAGCHRELAYPCVSSSDC